ncbi:hypothetical protein B0T16DRAFT_487609 [Cercophora newfieldiana]|uniref:Uncharacterized protein n=1 Tax=Cercophora newfieldiana TaxID=92897 RepID=A0AA40CYL6_9PEZI|nr:hypothetical protein B0T16DRAFT_487609 [Cercophora newfieldiana]
MSRRRQAVTEVHHGGYVYRLGLSLSEQPPVLRVTSKFAYKTETPEAASITKEELLGLASVYHRIYQVPDKSKERLNKWRKAHRRMVESWQMPFWNSRADDQRQGLTPMKPGIPPEALGRNRVVQVLEEDDTDDTVDHKEIDVDQSSDAVKPREQTPASSPPVQRHPLLPSEVRGPVTPSHGGGDVESPVQVRAASMRPEHLKDELEAARRSIREMFFWFQRAVVTVDDNDPMKESLLRMSQKAAASLDRISQAVQDAHFVANKGEPESAEQLAERIAERRAQLARET